MRDEYRLIRYDSAGLADRGGRRVDRHQCQPPDWPRRRCRRASDATAGMFAANPQPMWVFDLETLAFLDVNDAAIRRYGYTPRGIPRR
jgi:PAS domain-containing protein